MAGEKHSGSGGETCTASDRVPAGLQRLLHAVTMSRRRKAVIESSSGEEGVPVAAAGAEASPLRPRGRLRKAGGAGSSAAKAELGSAAAAGAAAAAPAQLVTPTRPAPNRALPQESPREGTQRGRTQQKLRDRGTRSAAKQRQQRALQRLCSGRGGVNDLDEEGKLFSGNIEAIDTHVYVLALPSSRKWHQGCPGSHCPPLQTAAAAAAAVKRNPS